MLLIHLDTSEQLLQNPKHARVHTSNTGVVTQTHTTRWAETLVHSCILSNITKLWASSGQAAPVEMLNMTEAIPERCYTCPQVGLRRSAAGVVLTWVSGCPWTPPWTRCPEAQSRLSHTPGSRALPWRRCLVSLKTKFKLSSSLWSADTRWTLAGFSARASSPSVDDAHRHKKSNCSHVQMTDKKKKRKLL